VVGCGTAGAAAALFLRRQGHRVTVLEQVVQPGPVGAGIILQPSGQAVLRCLGVDRAVFAAGEPLRGLTVLKAAGDEAAALTEGANVNRAPLMALRYDDVPGDHVGLGLHRGVLFQTLFDAVRREDIDLRLGVVGQDVARERANRWIVTPEGKHLGPFDLVVVADGARSKFRDDTQLTTRADPYPWGALWFMADDPDHHFRDELFQVVQSTGILIGLLPTGFDVAGRRKVSFFFSVRADRAAEVRAMDVDAFRAFVCRVVPEAEPVLAQLGSCADLLYSGYFDIVMSTWHTRAVVHLGPNQARSGSVRGNFS
jgi:2-polyprenyl-6-methoxyphenol hydroxylase-like FAD-dependent oxidoreductase